MTLAHLSLELGHLHPGSLRPRRLREQFARVAPWAAAARAAATVPVGGQPRISTCYLVDDYTGRGAGPAEVVPWLLAEAERAGLVIDYLARESAFAGIGGRGPAGLVEAGLVEARLLSPPQEYDDGSRRIESAGPSVLLDVELRAERDGRRTWSCPHLAAVWQLLRLGLLRERGRPALTPVPCGGPLPEDWDRMPPLLRLNPAAAPFTAYRTCSVLDARYLPVEHAVRAIVGRWVPEEPVRRQLADRARGEGIRLPDRIADRIGYVFHGPP